MGANVGSDSVVWDKVAEDNRDDWDVLGVDADGCVDDDDRGPIVEDDVVEDGAVVEAEEEDVVDMDVVSVLVQSHVQS